MWKMRLTKIGGQTAEGDYMIYRRHQVVGRVMPSPSMPGVQAYQWSTITQPGDSGHADNLQDAAEKLRGAIRRRWSDEVAEVPRSGTKFNGDIV